tara:strand:- start:53 stop:376 length:324 start_codon:yes stop_codon:yes gene_type:complete
MFDQNIQKMKGSLVLNKQDQLAFFYEAALAFAPEWASIDVERGEIYLGGNENVEGVGVKLGEIDETIYERVLRENKILLVHFQDGDVRNTDQAIWVPLTVAHQHSSV